MENLYLCTIMAKLNSISIAYKNYTFGVAVIPNVFSDINSEILIGPQSLNEAVYNRNGYIDDIACIFLIKYMTHSSYQTVKNARLKVGAL